uniref:Uncharacterized protein n=1 Tax=Oryza brachyantha TaxID=4533 RepID=J3KUF7_ORYBR
MTHLFENWLNGVNSRLKVIFRATYWVRSWSLLLNEEDDNLTKECCKLLEMRVLEFYSRYGWNFPRRIQD